MYSGGHSGDGVVESVAVCAIPRLLYKWSHGTTSQLMEIPPLLVHPCQCQMVSIINKKYNVHVLVDINNLSQDYIQPVEILSTLCPSLELSIESEISQIKRPLVSTKFSSMIHWLLLKNAHIAQYQFQGDQISHFAQYFSAI